jgi:hypothetical protein
VDETVASSALAAVAESVAETPLCNTYLPSNISGGSWVVTAVPVARADTVGDGDVTPRTSVYKQSLWGHAVVSGRDTAWWWCHLLRCYIILTTINARYSPNTPTTRHHSVDADVDTLLVAVVAVVAVTDAGRQVGSCGR